MFFRDISFHQGVVESLQARAPQTGAPSSVQNREMEDGGMEASCEWSFPEHPSLYYKYNDYSLDRNYNSNVKKDNINTLEYRVYYSKGRYMLMTRTFIEVPLFTKRWKEIGLNDDELQAFQIMLLKDPESGPIMEGTGGIRKVRFPLENRSKRGSGKK